jgi:hypothetical protein
MVWTGVVVVVIDICVVVGSEVVGIGVDVPGPRVVAVATGRVVVAVARGPPLEPFSTTIALITPATMMTATPSATIVLRFIWPASRPPIRQF